MVNTGFMLDNLTGRTMMIGAMLLWHSFRMNYLYGRVNKIFVIEAYCLCKSIWTKRKLGLQVSETVQYAVECFKTLIVGPYTADCWRLVP